MTVNLTGASGPFTVEWMESETGRTKQEGLIGGSERMLTVPSRAGRRCILEGMMGTAAGSSEQRAAKKWFCNFCRRERPMKFMQNNL